MLIPVKLKELGDIITGNTPSKKEISYWDSKDICFVKPDSISEQGISIVKNTTEYLSEKASSKARIVTKDAVFVTCIGTIGKIGLAAEGRYAFNQQINVVVPNTKVLPKYLAYALLSSKKRLEDIANAPVVPIINKTQFGEFSIKIEDNTLLQKDIVNILDKVVGIIDFRRRELQCLDNLVKARFVEMFGDPEMNPYGWQKINISNIVQGKVSNGYFAKRDEYVEDGNAAILGVAYIVNRMYSGIEGLPRTNVTLADIQKYKVRYGDMLFCRSSLVAEGIGKASIVPENVPDNTLFECHVIRLPLDMDKCVPEFMQVLSTTDYFRKQMIAQSKTATMTTIGQDGIKKANIILPPIEKQREFYSFVKQIDKSKVAIQKSLAETQLLFDKLMQDYFG